MKPKELNVKVNDRVTVEGCKGTVLEVYKGVDISNGKSYTNVRVHFDETEYLSKFGQYQDADYGDFHVID